MAHESVRRQRDEHLLRAIDELFATIDDDRIENEERQRQRECAHAESLQRRLDLVFHDLGLSEFTDGWSTANDGRLSFVDLDARRAERLILALEQVSRKYARVRWAP
jgi:hypothetical protein